MVWAPALIGYGVVTRQTQLRSKVRGGLQALLIQGGRGAGAGHGHISVCRPTEEKVGESSFVFRLRPGGAGARGGGADCVRQAIVIRCRKVGIRAPGHKTHTGARGREGRSRTQTQAHSKDLAVAVGRAEMRAVKSRIGSGYCYHGKLRQTDTSPEAKDPRRAIKQ